MKEIRRVDRVEDTIYNLSEEKEAFFIEQKMKKLFSVKLSKSKVTLLATCLLIIGSGTAFGTHELTKQTISVSINGNKQQLRTHAETVGELLESIGISTRSEDKISPAKQTKLENNMKVAYVASKPVRLTMDGQKETIWTTAETVDEFLSEQKLDLGAHDKVQPSKDTRLAKGTELAIEKAFQISLSDAGKEKHLWTTSTTVADFLKQHDLELNDTDKIEPSLDEKLTADHKVTITRIEKVTDVVEERIAYQVKRKEDRSLESGKEKVVQNGKEGTLKKHYNVVLENGKEVSRKLVKEETADGSIDKIVAVGTKEKKNQVVATAENTQVSRSTNSTGKEYFVASTAYTASCSGCSGRTATGIDLKNNPGAKVIAVDPSFIPLGTKVHVEGYGYAIAADTGSAIKGSKIDVFFPDKSSAFRWGNKRVKIKVLK